MLRVRVCIDLQTEKERHVMTKWPHHAVPERRLARLPRSTDAVLLLLPHGRPSKGSQGDSQIKRSAKRAYVLARLRRDGRADLIEKVDSGALSVRGALAAMTDKQRSRQ
jgi:hypothetical protein